MKLSRVKRPTPKPQRAAGSAGAREHFGRWAFDSGEAGSRPSAFGPQNGVALVVTLIMLSIITFLAVAFLVLSQRENASSNTALDQKTSKMAADSGMTRACAEILSDGIVNTNFENFAMKVSTNYISYMGFNPGLVNPLQPNNVNYDYLTNKYGLGGPPLTTTAQWDQNIASLEFNPRAPVFVVTNSGTGAMDFRYYIDLNRNGSFERNGLWPVVVLDNTGKPSYMATNGTLVNISSGPPYPWLISNNFVGDPEWIGVLERPQELHSADNRFTSRYAYLVVPAGNTLDINYIHNHAKHTAPFGEGFYRNQGVGTYEDNMAGFFADLNTNMWWTNTPFGGAYFYNLNANGLSSGLAFSNANDILSYRYAGNAFNTLNAASVLYPNSGAAWNNAHLDLFASGPLMLGASLTPPFPFTATFPWSGADNTNHVWSIQDFFNSSILPGSTLPYNLQTLGRSNDSYNAYTYYRMISQLGSDSAPEKYKLNVNWKNVDNQGNIVPGMETNQIPWGPLEFFTIAADRMFRQMNMRDLNNNLITVTNIPFYELPSNLTYGTTNINYYTPAVHRILQLAANIYDATGQTNRFFNTGPTNYPSVFRPIFKVHNGVGFIAGYTNVENGIGGDAFLPFSTMSNFVAAAPADVLNPFVNIYGVPWVIGVKKGFPNFNEMSMVNEIGVQRELQFTNKTSTHPWDTNQLFNFYITNRLGIEGWNSYSNLYGRNLKLYVSNQFSMTITNAAGIPILNVFEPYGTVTNIPTWLGGAAPQVQYFTNSLFTNGNYIAGSFTPLNPVVWKSTQLPRMFMSFNFQLQYVLIDTVANRVIDFVNLTGPQPQLQNVINDPMEISGMLAQNANEKIDISGNGARGNDIFATNFQGGILIGVLNQIYGEGGGYIPGTPIDPFLNNKLNGLIAFDEPSAIGTIEQSVSWQANDPLVHYTAQDLTSMEGKLVTYNRTYMVPPGSLPGAITTVLPNLGKTNFTYRPWPNNPQNPDTVSSSDSNFQMKDSLATNSDAWDFPTNKLWDIGVMGRIHRGTPWQTVYLKPTNGLALNNWAQWANDPVIITNGNVATSDAANSLPSQDYLLFDLFTSAPNDNSTRGQLNINQPGLAAWAAIFSGVNVISNAPNGQVPITISPAGAYDPNNPTPLARIWEGITFTRTNNNPTNGPVFPNGNFQHLGDILNTPQLTVASPFVNTNGSVPTDEEMERIPQQVMSLLTLNQDPRFVIYSFGQTLHPADHSQVTGGAFNGLCTNYQITAETATRAVVRVEGSPDPQWTKAHPDPQGRYYPPHIVVEQFNVLGPD